MIHPLWIVAMAIVFFIVGVPVVVVVLALTLGRRRIGPVPTLSPDGRFWWDGHSWQPVPQQTPEPPAPLA